MNRRNRGNDPSPPEDPRKTSRDNLVTRSCMCPLSDCDCGPADVQVMRSIPVSAVRCPGCAGGIHPGAG